MQNRFRNAVECAEGKPNSLKAAMALVDAIKECRGAYIPEAGDPAVMVLLHAVNQSLGGVELIEKSINYEYDLDDCKHRMQT